MIKCSFFEGIREGVPQVISLFGSQDQVFEKLAAPYLLPEVQRYIAQLRPRDNAQYVLVNAMGAGEYYGSNSNGDRFSEAALVHAPDDWTGEPELDKDKAKLWPYGFPTFYNAKAYAHHRNKNAERGLGDVELAAWNPHMKRVELVVRLDKDRCQVFDGQATWDKLKTGQPVDVSMGTRVPFDTASCCLDNKLYQEAWSTFDPNKHKHPGEAILEFHKRLKAKNGIGIRGLSITRHDYCPEAQRNMNRIYPDGRKVWVDNDFPRFFDISFVFIGADKIAKTMLKIADQGRMVFMGSAEMAEKLGMQEPGEQQEKTAALLVEAKQKSSEIQKDVMPNQLAGKAVPLVEKSEGHLQPASMRALLGQPSGQALSTVTGMGMVLKPEEFAELLGGLEELPELSGDLFSPALAQALMGELPNRSGLGPVIERRIIFISHQPEQAPAALTTKQASLYRQYRLQALSLLAETQELLEKTGAQQDRLVQELISCPPEQLFTPLSFQYFRTAYLDLNPPGV